MTTHLIHGWVPVSNIDPADLHLPLHLPAIMTDSFKKTILYREYPEVAQLVTRLHELSEQQDAQGTGISSLNGQNVQTRDFSMYKHKMVALEQDKSELIYAVLRNKKARRIFEAGTSYGVSTIYLLLASQAADAKLSKKDGPPAMVWGTEKEEHKADAAMENLAEAMKLPDGTKDIPGFTMLRGDILELTEKANIESESLDAVLFDIWAESEYTLSTTMQLSSCGRPDPDTDADPCPCVCCHSVALPTFKLLEASLKPDAVIFIDNWLTGIEIGTYAKLHEYLESKGWYTVALPFKNGLGMATRVASS
ncbi:O-methyltransferase [Pseudozyma hubeiensis SY62]|uniref:O-methyltransferase n=1 Tax=Pseudozyma hubeiensis (strain SY62) TaxID=1305764 RepID=R9PI75_PSEHS|nr:O-methyltransferase [Pseudozyma hubeiensis SY62]GAC97790.1 O-methyltransferase [Pseudozyma hubeiensis SY62]